MGLYRLRHENKYLINEMDKVILKMRAEGILMRDSHTDEEGKYIIRSLYFDDCHDTKLNENIIGSDVRSKFRIRYYNDDTGRIALEKKSKIHGMCLKESVMISIKECEMMINGMLDVLCKEAVKKLPESDEKTLDVNNKDVRKYNLFNEMHMQSLIPKTIVTYERIPYIYSAGNVRVTFDDKISSSCDFEKFLTGDYTKRPVLDVGESIMEVKWDELLPLYIKETMHIDEYSPTAFSKYYMCRMYHL